MSSVAATSTYGDRRLADAEVSIYRGIDIQMQCRGVSRTLRIMAMRTVRIEIRARTLFNSQYLYHWHLWCALQ